MATGMEAHVTLPLNKRPRGLLLDEANRIPDGVRWTAGVTLRPWGCGGFVPVDADYCDYDSDELDDFFDVGPWADFGPFTIYNTESCVAREADILDINGRLKTRWSVMVSEQVASRLNSEMATRGTVFTTGPVNTSVALANVEEALALTLHGGRGFVHMSPAALSVFREKLVFNDGRWETVSGHIVVADAGHTGIPPTGHAAVGGTEWIYTSGAVVYGLTDAVIGDSANEYLDRSHNRITGRATGTALVAFDPCSVSAIQYGFPDFGGSGS